MITGGSRGIGKGLVTHLLKAGYDVAFTYLNNKEAATAVELEIAELGGKTIGYRCDIRDGIQVRDVYSRARGEMGGAPSGLINNVGIAREKPLYNMSSEDWYDVVNTNLNGMFEMTHTVMPDMVEAGEGSIIQMSSVAGLRGFSGLTGYCATKSAMIGFSKALAIELARFNVTVNAIAPGYIDTDLTRALPDTTMKKKLSHVPARRLGSVEDIAALAGFLLSPNARYTTGQVYTVDGGLSA